MALSTKRVITWHDEDAAAVKQVMAANESCSDIGAVRAIIRPW